MKRTLHIIALVAICAAAQIQAMSAATRRAAQQAAEAAQQYGKTVGKQVTEAAKAEMEAAGRLAKPNVLSQDTEALQQEAKRMAEGAVAGRGMMGGVRSSVQQAAEEQALIAKSMGEDISAQTARGQATMGKGIGLGSEALKEGKGIFHRKYVVEPLKEELGEYSQELQTAVERAEAQKFANIRAEEALDKVLLENPNIKRIEAQKLANIRAEEALGKVLLENPNIKRIDEEMLANVRVEKALDKALERELAAPFPKKDVLDGIKKQLETNKTEFSNLCAEKNANPGYRAAKKKMDALKQEFSNLCAEKQTIPEYRAAKKKMDALKQEFSEVHWKEKAVLKEKERLGELANKLQ